VQKDDLIICAELSRLGRNLFMIIEILNICIARKCNVQTIKENFRLENNIQSKVLAFAFGLSAEIERQLISQRTKEALARRKAIGIKLGRKPGVRGKLNKTCCENEAEIEKMLEKGTAKVKIARKLGISTGTLYRFLVYTGKYMPSDRTSEKWKKGIYQ